MIPEIQLEQLLHYTIGAHELIPQVQASPKPYTQAILPYGSPLYTGILQAAGYLLLRTGDICYIDIQQNQEALMMQKTGTFGPILGQKWDITPLEAKLPQSNQRTKSDIEICLWQLGLYHIIQGTQNIHRISIRAELSPEEKKQVCAYFKKKKKMNFVWLANLASKSTHSDSQDTANRKKDSQNKDHKLFQLFTGVNAKQQIIAYTGRDFSIEKEEKAGYTCIVA